MSSELMPSLLRLTLFTSITVLILLAIRVPLRRFFGAGAAYQAWLLVPLVTMVACLPTRTTPVLQVAAAMRTVRVLATRMVPAPSLQIDLLLVVWAAGALALAGWFLHAHQAFRRAAGTLRQAGGVYLSAGDAGPASVGLLRPIVIVPHDFMQRYGAAEQALVIAHEQVHIARRDALANLLQAAFQCLFWFNPLVHLAALRFRQDQELSCDARVMAHHPGQRRTYAEALLKSHRRAPLQDGINCHWQTHHPIKERLMQLQSSAPRLSRRIAGRWLVGLLAAGAMFGTLAARAEPAAPVYAVAMTIDAGGTQASPRVLAKGGEQFAVASGAWRIEMTVRGAKEAGNVWVVSKVYKDGKVVGAPNLLAHLNEQVGVKVGDSVDPFALSMVVTQQP
jgi:bla regulator protein BlaR1